MTTLAREYYGVLQLVVRWLQQPTIIEVAAAVDVHHAELAHADRQHRVHGDADHHASPH